MSVQSMNCLLAILGTAYILSFTVLYRVLLKSRLPRGLYSTAVVSPRVSIVIPARNESARILGCITALERIRYPESDYEIVFVDDGSTDNTAELIEEFASKHANWRLLRFNKPKGAHGPMLSIAHGVRNSRHDIILRTDADCAAKRDWLQAMTAQFDDRTAMVIGVCNMKSGPGPIQGFLSFDNLVLSLLNCAFASLGFPTGCSGGNMAFRKDAFLAVWRAAPFERFHSGEDTHLVHLFHKHKVGAIKSCLSPDGVVNTYSPERWRETLHRMVRVNSETIKMDIRQIAVRFAFLAGYAAPFLLMCNGMACLGATLIAVRFLTEYLFLSSGAKAYRKTYPMPRNAVYQSVYPVYLAFFAVIGAFGKFKWR